MTCSHCDALRRQLADAREEIAAWEAFARDERRSDADSDRLAAWRQAFDIRGSAPILTLMLLADRPGRLVTPLMVVEATRIPGRSKDTDDVEMKVSRAFMNHVRKGLRRMVVTGDLSAAFDTKTTGITTIWGQGWTMTAENAAAVRALAGEA